MTFYPEREPRLVKRPVIHQGHRNSLCPSFWLALPLLSLILFTGCGEPPRTSKPAAHQAYVWQRSWNSNVVEAVLQNGPVFDSLIVLKSEVTWKSGTPTSVDVPISFSALKKTGVAVGLAIRMGAFDGPFSEADKNAQFLVGIAKSAIAQAASNNCPVAELQLDFDCADSKIGPYRRWVQVIRKAVHPVPLTLTALPSWLNQSDCPALLKAADGFVLQVHSLQRPSGPDLPYTLCDPNLSRNAVEKAAKIGIPFRVSLPTYGYTLAFETNGSFAGLSSEGPKLDWKKGLTIREVRSDPAVIADLVERWDQNRPAALTGFLWYRLPVSGDRMNWTWPTLATVKAGKVPRPFLKTQTTRTVTNLFEIELINRGDGDYLGSLRIAARWNGARAVASDGWNSFIPSNSSPQHVDLIRTNTRIAAGERIKAGWIRLDKNSEVTLELEQ